VAAKRAGRDLRKIQKKYDRSQYVIENTGSQSKRSQELFEKKELFDTSGAKAKKYSKSNETSFLKVTNLAVLCARKDANSPQNKQKCPVKPKTKRSFRSVGENDNKSATPAPDVHRSPACPEVYIRPRDCTIRSSGGLTSSREFC